MVDRLETTEGVNHSGRQRRYGAQDKEELIITITKLHEEDLSQVAIAKKLGLSRGTIFTVESRTSIFQT